MQEPGYPAQDLSIKGILLIYIEFRELFLEEKGIEALLVHKPYNHTIPIQESKEVLFGPIYQISTKELEELKNYININLKKRFIRESQLPAGSPVLFVPKPNRKLKLCIDYCLLNTVTVKD